MSQFTITTDGGMTSVPSSMVADGYMWRIAKGVYKWDKNQQKLVFVKHGLTHVQSTGFGAITVDNNTTKAEIQEMATSGSVSCRSIQGVKVNGVCGKVCKDDDGKEYLEW